MATLPSAVAARSCSHVVQAAAGTVYSVVVLEDERAGTGYEMLEASKGCWGHVDFAGFLVRTREFPGCSTAQPQQDLGVICPPAAHGRFGQCKSGPGNNCS